MKTRSKVQKPKYIAEGFYEDALDLLNDFIQRGTVEFSEFAEIWKKHHFSLVFMGRPDHIESTEFTNEAYKISSEFLSSASFYEKVGAVYLLYALFRNQISVPTIKIRIDINQWRVIKTLHIEARLKNYKTLHYVIDYLVKNAFIYVVHQMLKGPLTGMQKGLTKYNAVTTLKTSYKSDIMEYSVSNNLQALRDLSMQYLEEKKKFSSDVKINLNNTSDTYELFIHDLKDLVESGPLKRAKETVGSRRAKIKAQSFLRQTQDRFGNEEQNIDECDPHANLNTTKNKSGKKKSIRNKRPPPEKRTIGRPRKNPKPSEEPEPQSEDEEIDISHLLSQQQEFYLPPEKNEYRKNKRRRDHYYKLSPKREESSDPDDPV